MEKYKIYLTKSLRTKDLIFFLEHKQISIETYNRYIWQTIEQFPEQINDLRFYYIQNTCTDTEIPILFRENTH